MDEALKIQIDGLITDNPSFVHTQPAKKFLGLTLEQACLKLFFKPVGNTLKGAVYKYSNGLYTIRLIRLTDTSTDLIYAIYPPNGKVSWWIDNLNSNRRSQRKLGKEDAQRFENEAKLYLQSGNTVGKLPTELPGVPDNIANMEI